MKEHMNLIGKKAKYSFKNGIIINVTIADIRSAWGRTDAQITPVSGSGSTWVDISYLSISSY